MEVEEASAVNEDYYCIEDMDGELFVLTPEKSSHANIHTCIQREFENGKGTYFFCATCEKSYLNVEDYLASHEKFEKAEEDSVDDLIEYDETDDHSLCKNKTIESEEELLCTSDYFIETSEGKYFCYDCRTVFKELEDAEQHDCPWTVQATNKRAPIKEIMKFLCAFCEVNFKDLAALEFHQIKCSVEEKISEKLECYVCQKSFVTFKALNVHKRSHEREENNLTMQEGVCHVCNITFGSNKRLKLHMKMHSEQPLRSIQQALPEIAKKDYSRLDHFFCEICNKSFDQKLLAIHKNMHQHVKKYVCNLCNRHFEDNQSYVVHQQLHKPKDKNFSISSSSIRNQPTEAIGRNTKKDAKPIYPCRYCGHVFYRPFEKTRHERVHTGEKPYSCEICGKNFRVPYSLTLHLRTHTDVRPFVCPTCNKRFKSYSVYNHHLNIHLNYRSYSCDVCEKSFRTSVQLNAHKNSHIKPFNCTVCNRPFASLHAVKQHMKSHDKRNTPGISEHRCNVCGAIYARVTFLRAHLRDHHGVEETKTVNFNGFDEQTDLRNDETKDYVEENETDAAAALLITAAADAEASFIRSQNVTSHIVDQGYLKNEAR